MSRRDYDERLAALTRRAVDGRGVLIAERIDVNTALDAAGPTGARHPITILAEHIADTFIAMGMGNLPKGPKSNPSNSTFDALNFPAEPTRPAVNRDTFYIATGRFRVQPAAYAQPRRCRCVALLRAHVARCT